MRLLLPSDEYQDLVFVSQGTEAAHDSSRQFL